MANDNAVANPPAGGPQEQASTNDDNQNTILRDAPYVVTVDAHGQTGVVARYASQADANSAADARRKTLPGRTTVKVVKENDISNGLPARVAEVEEAEFGDLDDTASDDKPAPAPKTASAKS